MAAEKQNTATCDGYYYSSDLAVIVQAQVGQTLPDADDWEYLGSAREMTPADAVAALQNRYPDVSVELTFKRL